MTSRINKLKEAKELLNKEFNNTFKALELANHIEQFIESLPPHCECCGYTAEEYNLKNEEFFSKEEPSLCEDCFIDNSIICENCHTRFIETEESKSRYRQSLTHEELSFCCKECKYAFEDAEELLRRGFYGYHEIEVL